MNTYLQQVPDGWSRDDLWAVYQLKEAIELAQHLEDESANHTGDDRTRLQNAAQDLRTKANDIGKQNAERARGRENRQ